MKKAPAVLLPAVAVDINDVVGGCIDRSGATPAHVTSIRVVIVLIIPEFVFQVSGGPEKRVVQ